MKRSKLLAETLDQLNSIRMNLLELEQDEFEQNQRGQDEFEQSALVDSIDAARMILDNLGIKQLRGVKK